MRVSFIYSTDDVREVNRIREALEDSNHEVIDYYSVKGGAVSRLKKSIEVSDAIIVVISKYTLYSKSLLYDQSSTAILRLTKLKKKVVPILLDDSPIPYYLSGFMYIDFSENYAKGLEKLLTLLAATNNVGINEPLAKSSAEEENKEKQQNVLRNALRSGQLTIVCGAGVSIGAGVPDWNNLLLDLLSTMINRIAQTHRINLTDDTSAEFQKRYNSSAIILGKYLKANLGKDFFGELRDALYKTNPTTCKLIDSIVDLARPQRDAKPLDSIITFNFDNLIEENLKSNHVSSRSIYTEGVRHQSNELPVYHVHGYLPRTGKISSDTDIVFSEDAYHSQFIDPFSWSNLIQLAKLSQNTCLLIGVSLTDPNLRRLLDVAQRKNPDRVLSHYIIKKSPSSEKTSNECDYLGRLLEEQDANSLGLNVVWVDDFNDITAFLHGLVDHN